ncbi:bifunctional nicotinamidase/pyrazinamidase [Fusobacterium sp.]|uniref:bifunctional nicotinamidase/pyrazinamidase n=1 Tax=Fusobacterium sp. TaxID=68766 RepID=UPI002905507F|nr:bifunctional nicotinamidase/pyrazinamidase [Fusobacterium sp.]MDU1911734.1 bifunctional nicotinamidase/pyrazinamidase [Fusobacterium sp.]
MNGLILVDIQKDFCKNGALEVKDGDTIVPIANKLIELFKEKGEMIIGTKDWHPSSHKSFAVNSDQKIGEAGQLNGLYQIWWPVHCVQNENGAEFHSKLHPIENIVYKGENPEIDSYSAFFDNGKKHKTSLDDILKKNNIDTLYIMGLATDYCVKFTVLDALELGYKVYLIEDGCKGVDIFPEDSKKAINEMKNKGAVIINSNNI